MPKRLGDLKKEFGISKNAVYRLIHKLNIKSEHALYSDEDVERLREAFKNRKSTGLISDYYRLSIKREDGLYEVVAAGLSKTRAIALRHQYHIAGIKAYIISCGSKEEQWKQQ